MRARRRLSKLLLRHGVVYYGGNAWTDLHERWLRAQRFPDAAVRAAFVEDFDTVLATARRDRLDKAILDVAKDPQWAPALHRHQQGARRPPGQSHTRRAGPRRVGRPRLHHRWNTLDARGKRPTITAVAVARELAGWCWSMATMND
jgi:hypothetical protein